MSEPGRSRDGGRDSGPLVETALVCALIGVRLLISGRIHPDTGYFVNGAAALLLLFLVLRAPGRLRIAEPLVKWGLGLYFFAAVFSIPFSIMPWSSLRQLLFHLGDLLLMSALLGAGKKALKPAAATILASVSLSALFALRQRIGGFESALEAFPEAGDYVLKTLAAGRVFGLTFSPDMLAGAIAGTLPLALSFSLLGWRGRSPGRLSRRRIAALALPLIALSLLCVTLILTRSLGGCLAAGGGVVIWIIAQTLPQWRKGIWKPAAALSAAMILLTLLAGLLVVHLRGGHFLDLESRHNPVTMRLDNWRTGLKIWKEFPAAGAGIGQFGLAVFAHRSLEGNEAKHAHNFLVEIPAETGPLGLIGALLLLAGFSRRSLELMRRQTKADEPERELVAGYLAGAAAVVLHCFIDYDWQVPEVAALFWIGLAVAVMPEAEAKPTGVPAGPRRRALVWAMGAALLMTAFAQFHQGTRSRLAASAVAAARQGNWEMARDQGRAALALGDVEDELHVLLAQAELHLAPDREQGLRRGLSHLERAIALNPRNPFHHFWAGRFMAPLDPDQAGRHFARALSLYPNSQDINLDWGRWLRTQGRYEEAEKALQHAVRAGPANAELLFELGRLYLEQGEPARAEELFKRAISMPPPRPELVQWFAQWLMEQGRSDEARALLEKYRLVELD